MDVKDTKIVNLDEGTFWKKEMDVVGMAETLPFKNESFDIVLAHLGSYREDEVEINPRNAEMFRKILEELGYIYEENPKLIVKITKISETGGNYGYSLEIKK